MSGALAVHRPFAERPESNEDGEERGVGLGYINPPLDFLSCLFILRTWLCFYQNPFGALPWSVSLLFLPKSRDDRLMGRVAFLSAFYTQNDPRKCNGVCLLFFPKTLLQREPWSLSASLPSSKLRSFIPHGVSLSPTL